MRKIMFSLVALSVVFVLLISGCAPKATPVPAEPPAAEEPAAEEPAAEEPVAEEPTAEESPEEAEPVILRMAVFIIPAWMDYYTQKAEEFHEVYPNIMVETELVGAEEYFVDMALQLAAGVGPDLIFVCNTVNFPEFAAAGYLVPLDSYVEQHGVDLADYVPEAIEGATWEGELYALPDSFHNGVSILYYNKTMFDEAGIAYPTDEWTYDDMAAAAAQLTKDTDGDGLIDQYGWYPLEFTRNIAENATTMRSFGCSWMDESGTTSQADSPECLEAIQFVYDNLDSAPMFDATIGHDELFTAGQVAMLTQGPWVLEGYRSSLEALGMEVGTAKIPIGPAGRLSAGAAYGAHGITVMSEHPEEAALWVEWLTNEDNVKDFATLNLSQPARLSSLETWVDNFPMEAPAAAAVEYGAPPLNNPANLRKAEMSSLVFQTMQAVWLKEATPEEALSDLHVALQDLLDQPAP